MKFKKSLIIVLCVVAVFLLYWYRDQNLQWQEMTELHAIDVYRPTGTDKFGNEFLYTVDDRETLAALENLFNNVEYSSEIKQIVIEDEVFEAYYSAMLDIRSTYTANADGKKEVGQRLLHLFIEDETGHSYLIVVGTGKGYVFDANDTQIFVDLLVA